VCLGSRLVVAVGELGGRLGSLSCRRRPPSHPFPPHLSFPRLPTPTHLHTLGCWVCRNKRTAAGSPVWQVLSGTSGATRGPHYGEWESRATRLSALRTLSVSKSPANWPVHQFPSAQDHTRTAQYAIRKCAGPSFEFRIDSLPISRISQTAPDHNLLLTYKTQYTMYNVIIYQPRWRGQIYYCPFLFHLSSTCLSLVLRYPQSKTRLLHSAGSAVQFKSFGDSVSHSACACAGPIGARSPTIVTAGLACLTRIDLFWILLLRSQRNQASNALPQPLMPPPRRSHLIAQKFHHLSAQTIHDAYTRY
jgi:hypothetical protein